MLYQMSKFRKHNHRADGNQKEIVDGLRKLGVSVEVGHDDILVGYQGKNYWVEIKTKDRFVIGENQKELLKNWKGQYLVAFSLDDVLEEIGFKHD